MLNFIIHRYEEEPDVAEAQYRELITCFEETIPPNWFKVRRTPDAFDSPSSIFLTVLEKWDNPGRSPSGALKSWANINDYSYISNNLMVTLITCEGRQVHKTQVPITTVRDLIVEAHYHEHVIGRDSVPSSDIDVESDDPFTSMVETGVAWITTPYLEIAERAGVFASSYGTTGTGETNEQRTTGTVSNAGVQRDMAASEYSNRSRGF